MQDAPLTYTKAAGERQGLVVIKLTGPLTLRQHLSVPAGPRRWPRELTVFDLSQVPYMDSAGIGPLINYYVS